MEDTSFQIAELQRTILIYELALEVYDEFIAKGTLESGGDIQAMMLDPGHPEFVQVVERFLQDPANCTPTNFLSLDVLLALVQQHRITASVRMTRLKAELADLDGTNLLL